MSNDTTKHPSAEHIRARIADRCAALSDSSNSHHQNHVEGVIRGLLIALTGRDHRAPHDLRDIFTAAEIPFTVSDGAEGPEIDIPAEWLRAHSLDDNWNLIEGPSGPPRETKPDPREGVTLCVRLPDAPDRLTATLAAIKQGGPR